MRWSKRRGWSIGRREGGDSRWAAAFYRRRAENGKKHTRIIGRRFGYALPSFRCRLSRPMVVVIVSIAADDDRSSSTYKTQNSKTDNTSKRPVRLGALL